LAATLPVVLVADGGAVEERKRIGKLLDFRQLAGWLRRSLVGAGHEADTRTQKEKGQRRNDTHEETSFDGFPRGDATDVRLDGSNPQRQRGTSFEGFRAARSSSRSASAAADTGLAVFLLVDVDDTNRGGHAGGRDVPAVGGGAKAASHVRELAQNRGP